MGVIRKPRYEVGKSSRKSAITRYNYRVSSTQKARFTHGAVVLVTLREPREKFWGAVLDVSAAGVEISGIGLAAFDDFTHQVRDGEDVNAAVVFFPMHRVERMELDIANGEIPSLRQKFLAVCSRPAESVLLPEEPAE